MHVLILKPKFYNYNNFNYNNNNNSSSCCSFNNNSYNNNNKIRVARNLSLNNNQILLSFIKECRVGKFRKRI